MNWQRLVLGLLLSLAVAATAHGARVVPPSKPPPPQEQLNDRPIIGILSQPGSPAPEGGSYIAASYIKWVEAAGARVVPILYDMERQEIEERFRVVNGLLLPGGGAVLRPGHPFFDAASRLVDLALDANDRGDYFPVWGTCLGMEVLSIIISRNTSILAHTDAEDAPAPLLYTDEARRSKLFQALPPRVVQHLQDLPLAMENHMHGLLMSAYQENPRLSSFFKVLSLSIDKSGDPYISTMESEKYPFTAVQYHPEKNAYEWPSWLHIPHSPAAVEMGQEMANYFVAQARRSKHRPANERQEDDFLVYNWAPQFTGRRAASGGEEEDFMQTYVFGSAAAEAAAGRLRRQQEQQQLQLPRAGSVRHRGGPQ